MFLHFPSPQRGEMLVENNPIKTSNRPALDLFLGLPSFRAELCQITILFVFDDQLFREKGVKPSPALQQAQDQTQRFLACETFGSQTPLAAETDRK